MRVRTIRVAPALAGALAAALTAVLLGACDSTATPAETTTTDTSTAETTTASSGSSEATGQASAVTVTDPWIKAVDSGMTGAFAVLENTSSTDVHIVDLSSDVSPMMELHETVMGDGGSLQMQEKQGGFVIKAGESHTFKPGGDHFMFMGVTEPVKSGTDVAFILEFEDGSTLPITAQARTFSGAQETYVPHETTGTHSMPGHSNSGHSNSGHNSSGHNSSGHDNSGHDNSGHDNSGHDSSGHDSSGHDMETSKTHG
ncbi:MAG: hypothetical protein CSA84_02945 [Actinomycetales bacterium]|nr:MAG: hypothetical protein CSA84_02945 [Actinomycetales bacterium]